MKGHYYENDCKNIEVLTLTISVKMDITNAEMMKSL
jgi:hypothetical protein